MGVDTHNLHTLLRLAIVILLVIGVQNLQLVTMEGGGGLPRGGDRGEGRGEGNPFRYNRLTW